MRRPVPAYSVCVCVCVWVRVRVCVCVCVWVRVCVCVSFDVVTLRESSLAVCSCLRLLNIMLTIKGRSAREHFFRSRQIVVPK